MAFFRSDSGTSICHKSNLRAIPSLQQDFVAHSQSVQRCGRPCPWDIPRLSRVCLRRYFEVCWEQSLIAFQCLGIRRPLLLLQVLFCIPRESWKEARVSVRWSLPDWRTPPRAYYPCDLACAFCTRWQRRSQQSRGRPIVSESATMVNW